MTLSPVCTIGKNESITHKETWILHDGVELGEFTEKSVAGIAEKLFGR